MGRGVIIQTAFLGDLLLSIPLLRQVKNHCKDEITVIVRQGLGNILTHLDLADSIIEINKKSIKEKIKLIQSLRSQSFDWVLSPHSSFTSHQMVMGISSPLKIGFESYFSSFIFHKSIKKRAHYPDALRQMSLLEGFLHLKQWNDLNSLMEPYKNLQTKETVHFFNEKIHNNLSMGMKDILLKKKPHQKKSNELSPLILLAPGSVWETKKWNFQAYKKLALRLLQLNFTVGLIGSLEEKNVADEIVKENSLIQNYCGLSLVQSLELMTEALCLVSNDSGAMHLASVAELPCISIFGPTVLSLGYRPWNSKATVIQKSLSCRPCGRHGHKQCPIGTHECMKIISVADVLSEIEILIRES